MIKVFVYGTLAFGIVRFLVLGRFVEAQPAALVGWKRVGKPFFGMTVVEDAPSTVHGFLITVSHDELEKLDRYERVEYRYTREEVLVENEKALVYVRRRG